MADHHHSGVPGSPSDSADRVANLLDLGRPADALDECGRALTLYPDNSELLALASMCTRRLGRFAEAVSLAERAVAAQPGDDYAHGMLASAQLAAGRPDLAAQTAYTAVQMRPNHWFHHARYAECLIALPGGRDQALQAAQRAVELAPDEPRAHGTLASVAYPTGAKPTFEHLNLAEAALHEALRLSPGNAAMLHDLARVRLARADHAGALSGFSDAIVMDPRRTGETALSNVRYALKRIVLFQSLMVIAATVLGSWIGGKNPSTVSRAAIVVLALALGVLLVVRWRAFLAGASARMVVGQVFRGARPLVGALVFVVLALGTLLLAAFLPGGGSMGALGAAFMLAFGAVSCVMLARSR